VSAVFIYVIKHPTTLEVKYVGKTIDPKYRFRKHLTERNKTYKCQWIKGMLAKGLKPLFEVIEECNSDNWEDRERHFIAHYRSVTITGLLNITDGGESGSSVKGTKMPQYVKDKISASNTGNDRPDLSEYNKTSKSIPVNQYDLSGNLIATHQSARAAAISIGRNQRRIQAMCKYGKVGEKTINHVAGFVFKYAIAS